MFATPTAAPLHETLASRMFGRFRPERVQPVAVEAVLAPVRAAVVVEDDEIPDLAQRVREVGEW